MKRDKIPRNVFAKGKQYYFVSAQGDRRVWTKLSPISDGLPAMYQALAKLKTEASGVLNMPALIGLWQTEVMVRNSDKTQRDDRARCKAVAEAFRDLMPAEIEPPDCAEFLGQFADKPRTFNAYRALLRELMRFAEAKGLRPAGSNPVPALRTMRTPARDRYITDSELRRIKVAAMRAQDRHGHAQETRSGPMLCALIDMAYLTGQAIGDLIALEWSKFGPHGIAFARQKVAKSTAAKVLIEWSPKLRDVERRLKDLRKKRRAFGLRVFCRQDGQAYTYWGASTAWRRAVKRAGISDCHFHDLRAKALTDKEQRDGMQAARHMGSHATEAQTADYVRNKAPVKTGATR